MNIMTSSSPPQPATTGTALPNGTALPVPPQEILHVEAQSNYVRITTLQRRYFIRSSMAECVARLPPSLGLRVHRSHWVAFAAVAGLSVGGGRLALKLNLGKDIPVARRRKSEITAWITHLQTQS